MCVCCLLYQNNIQSLHNNDKFDEIWLKLTYSENIDKCSIYIDNSFVVDVTYWKINIYYYLSLISWNSSFINLYQSFIIYIKEGKCNIRYHLLDITIRLQTIKESLSLKYSN